MLRSLLFSLLVMLMVGCSQHYFDRPLPVDSRNIYAFPEVFRGVWTDGKDSLIVGKYYFANIEYKDTSSPYIKADTNRYAIFKEGKVYPYDSVTQQVMGRGYTYAVRNDSIFYQTREVIEAQLGRKAVLRAVGNEFALNVKNENQWWELFLLGATEKGKIIIRYPNTERMAELGILPVLASEEKDYFEAEWNTIEMERLIGAHVFSDTLMLLDQQSPR